MSKPSNDKLFPLSCKAHRDAPSFYACLEEFTNPQVVRPQSWEFDEKGELVTRWDRQTYPYVIRDCFEGKELGWTTEESRRAARQLVDIVREIPPKHNEHLMYSEVCATAEKDVVLNTFASMKHWQTMEKGHATVTHSKFLLWNLNFDEEHPEWAAQYKGPLWLGYQVYRLLNNGLQPYPAFGGAMMYWFYPSLKKEGQKDLFESYCPPVHATQEQAKVLERVLSFHEPSLWFSSQEEASKALSAVL